MNDELRVPTVALGAEIVLADGTRLEGQIFRSTLSDRHAGPPFADEWINGAAEFFPFRPSGSGGTVLLNKDQVVVARLPRNDETSEFDEALTHRAVAVRTAQCEVRGIIVIDMPSHHSRLLDHMNRTERFISVADGSSCWLVHKRFITEIHETDGVG